MTSKTSESKTISRAAAAPIQAKLKVSSPGDRYEVEADRAAAAVMNHIGSANDSPGPASLSISRLQNNGNNTQRCGEEEEAQLKIQCQEEEEEELQMKVQRQAEEEEEEMMQPKIQRQPEEEEEELQMKVQRHGEEEESIQAKENGNSSNGATSHVESRINQRRGQGSAMSDQVKGEMESGFGTDFSNVRIHNDSEASKMSSDLNAQAFTTGNDIYFNEGKYQPDTQSGKSLLAHELTHVVQQGGGGVALQRTFSAEEIQDYITNLEYYRARLDSRYHTITSFTTEGMRAADAMRAKLMVLCNYYEDAYGNYSRKMREAQEAADDQEFWTALTVGIAVGAVLSVGVVFLLPASAAAAATITTTEAVVAAGSSIVTSAGGAATYEAFSNESDELNAEGILPSVMRMNAWRNVAELYRQAANFVPSGRRLHMYTTAAEYLLGQFRLLQAGGQTDMTEDKMYELFSDISRVDSRMIDYDQVYSDTLQGIRDLQTRIDQIPTSPRDPIQLNMEQSIWILWMSDLDDSDILDNDVIEDYLHSTDVWVLGRVSRLGVDFGSVTTEADELAAIEAAGEHRNRIEAQFDELQGNLSD